MPATPRPSLLEGDVGRHLRRLALPLAWGMLAMTSFSVADTFFISRLGTQYLAALGFCLPVVMFFMGIIFGLSVGTSAAVSRVYGSGDFPRVQRLASDAVSLTAVIILVASVIGFFAQEHIFKLMGATPDLMPLIRSYMNIWYIGMPFMGVMMNGNACIRATGDTRFVSHMMTLLSVTNILLDPCLIFGFGPFPQMGMAGAAATHVVAAYVTCMVSLYVIIFKKKMIRTDLIIHPGLMDSWKRVLHVAIPSVISNQIAPISAAIITWMAARFGGEAVAALGVASRIEGLAILVFYSMGASVSIFTGQNFGAGNLGRIKEVTETASRYAVIWGFFTAAILWLFALEIPALFDKNPLVIAYTGHYLQWVPISYGAFGMMVVSNAALNSMGKPMQATVLILLRSVIIYVPFAYLLQHYMGFQGILVALMVTNFAVGLVSYLWNREVAS
ncbi:MAG: MATE family efflux transporter [Micavibrio sp.]|nr:MATE family efflux transporter [Micavibrio sp.]